MDTDSTIIEVYGVPSVSGSQKSVDWMGDKLTIHFLRPRNGGGEVEKVIYPTHIESRALVIFELPEVASRVLQRSHVLEVEGGRFHLEVRRVRRAEVDMPVMTYLNLGKFRSQAAAEDILRRHGFEICHKHSGSLYIAGTFLNLRAARSKLGELLSKEDLSQTLTPGPHFSSHTTGAVSKMHYQNGEAVHAGSRSEEDMRASSSRSSYSPPVGQGSRAFPGDSQPASSRRRQYMASHYSDAVRFLIDTNALCYAQHFCADKVEQILNSHRVNMEVGRTEHSDVRTVMLVGRNPETAQIELVDFLRKLQNTLRMQVISLSSMNQEQQARLKKRIQTYKDVFKVLVGNVGDTIQLVGSSTESYEMKQRILGEEVSLPSSSREGRAFQRGSVLRRSSSLPRTLSRVVTRDSEHQSVVAQGNSQMGHGERRPEPASPTKHHRTRTISESHDKVKAGRAVSGQGSLDTVPSDGAQRAAGKLKFPATKDSLHPVNNVKDFKNKLSSRKQ